MDECIGLLRNAFSLQAEKKVVNLPRNRIQTKDGMLNVMAATVQGLEVSGTKIYYGSRTGVSFVVLLFSTSEAKPIAMIEANRLGQIRTGAVSGLMTDIMAAKSSATLACAGTGYQAETQIEGVSAVRKLDRVLVYSRSREKREAFASSVGKKLGIEIRPVEDTSEFRNADIVVTATNSRTPVIPDAHLQDACHINAIGANRIGSNELEPATVCSARKVVVDSIEQAKLESGDLAAAAEKGCFDWSSVSEIWEAVSGNIMENRKATTERTLFKSLGIALEDVAAGKFIFDRAVRMGLGTWL
jgi:ornithine cyclodeaminase/alanine dehydrogenase-like protein (mu-crystallin family)